MLDREMPAEVESGERQPDARYQRMGLVVELEHRRQRRRLEH